MMLVEEKLVLVWGRPHKGEEDPTTGWRGSQAGQGTQSRRRAAPEPPECLDQGAGIHRQCQDASSASVGDVMLAPGSEVSWPTGAISKAL